MDTFQGRVGLQQRVLPAYRVVFMEALARQCQGGLCVFAGKPLPKEGIEPADKLHVAKLVPARNWNFLDPSSAWYMCWQLGMLRWLEEWQPEVLIVEANPRYPLTRRAVAWMQRNGHKVIGWGLGAPPMGGLFSGWRQSERVNLLQSLDAVIAYSRVGAEQYQQLGINPERVFVAANAVAPAPATPPAARPASFDGRPTILFIGRLQLRKRVDLLLQACTALPEDLQPRILIVGEGPASEALHQMAQKIYPATEFLGAKHGDELEPYFRQADLFILPGTGGLAIQQAMAHGLPVIAAQGDGTQDDLVRSENGWQIPANDLQALVNVLHSALSNPGRLRQMGEASYRIVVNEININKMVEVFIKAINQVCGG